MRQHIMLPKSTLKEFVVDQKLHYLDLSSNRIEQASARDYNTETDYYPDENEKFLSSKVETHLGRIRKRIKDYEQNKTIIVIDSDLVQWLIFVFVIQTIRMPSLSKQAHASSVFGSLLGLPESYYSILHHKASVRDSFLKDAYQSVASGKLKNYSANLIEIPQEYRKRSFLLNSSHFIGFGLYLMLVLTPYWGLILLPEHENIRLMDEGKLKYLAATVDHEVDLINKGAVSFEQSIQNPKLVGLPFELERTKMMLGGPI